MADGEIVINSKLDNKEFITNSRQLLAAIKSLQSTAERMGQGMSASARSYGSAMRNNIATSRELKAQITEMTDKVAKMRSELERRGEMNGAKQWVDMRDKIKQTETAFDAALEKAEKLREGKGIDSAAWQKANARVDQLAAALDDLHEKQQRMDRPSDATIIAYHQQAEAIKGVEAELDELKRQQVEVGGVGSGLQKIATSAGHAAVALAKIVGHGALTFLKKLAIGAKNAAIQLAKLSSKALKTGLSKIGSFVGGAAKSMLGFHRSQKSANGGLKVGLKNILKYAFGIRSLFFLFRRLRAAVKEGFEQLSKTNPEVKAALDGLNRALNGLKGSLASAFAPIFTAIAPALTTLINMLTAAINTVGAFFAALTGKGVYQKSVGGLSNVGKSAGGASKKVKELKRELAGFDELNILNDKDSGGGGGGSGGSGGGFSYKTVPIEGSIKDFADRLRKMWANGDFEKIGRLLAFKINMALITVKRMISWESVGDKISEGITTIATIINSLIDPEKGGVDFELIGETFAEGARTIMNSLNLFTIAIKWANVGVNIGKFFNGIVNVIDPDEVSDFLVNKMQAALDALRGFVETFGWGEAGDKFAQTVNKIVNKVGWKQLGLTLARAIHGPLKTLREAVGGFSFGQAGTKFAEAVNGFLSDKTLFADGAQVLNDTIKGILTFGTEFFSGIYAETAANNLKDALEKIDWDGIAKQAWTLFKTAVAKFGDFITVLFGGDVDADASNAVEAVEKMWERGSGGRKTDASSSGLAKTLGNAVSAVLVKLDEWIGNIPWSDWGVKIHDFLESLPWAEWGDLLATGLRNLLTNLDDIISAITYGENYQENDIWRTLHPGKAAQYDAEKILGSSDNVEEILEKFGMTAEEFVKLHAQADKAYKDYGLLGIIEGNEEEHDAYEKEQAILKALNFADAVDAIKEYTKEGNTIGDRIEEFASTYGLTPEEFKDALNEANIQIDQDALWEAFVNSGEAGGGYTDEEAAEIFATAGSQISEAADKITQREKWEEAIQWGDAGEEIGEAAAVAIEEAMPSPYDLYEQGYYNGFDNDAKGGSLWQKLGQWLGLSASAEEYDMLADAERKQTKASKKLTKAETKQTKELNGLNDGIDLNVNDTPLEKAVDGTVTAMVTVGFTPEGEKEEEEPKGLLEWLQAIFAPGVGVDATVSLTKGKELSKYTTIAGWLIALFMGGGVKKPIDVIRGNFTTIKEKIMSTVKWWGGTPQKPIDVIKGNFGTIRDKIVNTFRWWGGTPEKKIDIIKGNFESVRKKIEGVKNWWGGTPEKKIDVIKGNFDTVRKKIAEVKSWWGGTPEKPIDLKKNGWSTVYDWVYGSIGQTLIDMVVALGIKIPDWLKAVLRFLGFNVNGGYTYSDDGKTTGVNTATLSSNSFNYHPPVMASGTVVPYDVSAQIARSTAELQNTLDTNNDELIQAVVNAIAQAASSIVTAVGKGAKNGSNYTTKNAIDEINRQALMFNRSPIMG